MGAHTNLLNCDRAQLEKFFLAIPEKAFRAGQLLKWVHQQGVTDFMRMTNFSLKLREYLSTHAEIKLPKIAQQQKSADGTIKYLIQLEDLNFIEMVFIPEDGRGTLCISTQVGCPLNCSFCATGKIGFKRNLTPAEIIGQLWLAIRELSPDKTPTAHVITNVVLMGMGEPLLNLDNVITATNIMLDDLAYGLSKRRVTISTVGLIPELQRLREQSEVALAISLHAPNDELRSQLMPINKKYPLTQLIPVLQNYFRDKRRLVTIEYALIKGINDSEQHAKQLIRLLSHTPCKINLIPINPIGAHAHFAPAVETVDKFRNILMAAGFNTITRKTRGSDIAAACGQLAGKTMNSVYR